MIVKKHACNYCGKEVKDYLNYDGWIKLLMEEVTISKGRDEEGKAKVAYCEDHRMDFCSIQCLNDLLAAFINNMNKEKEL